MSRYRVTVTPGGWERWFLFTATIRRDGFCVGIGSGTTAFIALRVALAECRFRRRARALEPYREEVPHA